MKFDCTSRGFPRATFNDAYGHECSIQHSSIADYRALWLGVNEANPQIMAYYVARNGIKTNEKVGWVPYPIPEDVLLTTRMHINEEQVRDLIKALQNWLEDDHFDGKEAK